MRLSLLLLVYMLAFSSTDYAQENLIRFGEKDILEWDDFAGNVDSKSSASAYALVYLGYNLKPFNDGYIISTDAFFSCDSSWVRHKTLHGLEHENYHFKLTEIVRRRMLRELFIMQFHILDIYEVVSDRLDNYVLLHNQDQDYYDLKTDYGRDRKSQVEIENRLDSLLLDLNDYRFQYIVFMIENDVRIKERILTDDITKFKD